MQPVQQHTQKKRQDTFSIGYC